MAQEYIIMRVKKESHHKLKVGAVMADMSLSDYFEMLHDKYTRPIPTAPSKKKNKQVLK